MGAIEVRVGVDDWLTVEAREDGLSGRSIDEAHPVLMRSRPIEDPVIVMIRDAALDAIESVSPRALLQRRTFQASWSPERIAQVGEGQVRHLQTSERRRRLGPARGLLDDEVEPFPGLSTDTQTSPERGSDDRDFSGLME